MTNEPQHFNEQSNSEKPNSDLISGAQGSLDPESGLFLEGSVENKSVVMESDNFINYGATNPSFSFSLEGEQKLKPQLEVENYPPGMSVTGSRHLPVFDIAPYVASQKKKKRRRKNKVKGVSTLTEGFGQNKGKH